MYNILKSIIHILSFFVRVLVFLYYLKFVLNLTSGEIRKRGKFGGGSQEKGEEGQRRNDHDSPSAWRHHCAPGLRSLGHVGGKGADCVQAGPGAGLDHRNQEAAEWRRRREGVLPRGGRLLRRTFRLGSGAGHRLQRLEAGGQGVGGQRQEPVSSHLHLETEVSPRREILGRLSWRVNQRIERRKNCLTNV